MVSSKKKVKINRLSYTGQGGELFKMWLVNALLTIPTLGIYRFWAKVKIRKYQASHVKLGNAFFEHTGTGKELFIGFLKVVAIIIVLFSLPVILEVAGFSGLSALFYALIYVFVGYFLAVARYASVRYMASRTTWRGIRGRLGGSAIKYANYSMIRLFFNIISLGLLKPKSDILKHKFMMDNLQFGAQKFKFVGDSKGLMKPYLIQYMLVFAPLFIGFLIGGVMKGQELIENAERTIEERKQQELDGAGLQVDPVMHLANFNGAPQGSYNSYVVPAGYAAPSESTSTETEEIGEFEENVELSEEAVNELIGSMWPVFLLLYVLFPLVGLVIIAPYYAALSRKKFGGLVLGDLRFKNTMMAKDFIKLFLGNAVVLVITLTFGKSIVWKRNMQFLCKHIVIGGDLEEFSTKQVELQKASAGEGLGDALDLDIGFDIGL